MTKITINVKQVEELAGKLATLGPGRIGRGALEAVNAVTSRFQEKAIEGGIRDINLTDAYVRSKTDLRLGSSPFKPRAEIVTRGDLTVMGRFAGTTNYPSNNQAVRRAGLVPGRRSAGVLARVNRSQQLNEGQWFVMRLKNQDGLLGVFVRDDSIRPKNKRDGKAGKRHVYGPSPYQLFRRQIDVQGPQLRADLEAEAVTRISADIREALQ
jgi:hypothetical protein